MFKFVFVTSLLLGSASAQTDQLRAPGNNWNPEARRWEVTGTVRKAAEGRIRAVENIDASQLSVFSKDGQERTVVIRIGTLDAPATRLHFENFHLPENARVFVYGLDDTGRVTRVAGPYTGSGPTRSEEFWTRSIPARELVVELHLGEDLASLPFDLREIAELDGIEEVAVDAGGNPAVETRVSMYRGMAVEHQVVNGYGVWEGDILIGRTEELIPYRSEKQLERHGFAIATNRWPLGVVPYAIDPALPNQARITDAIAHWNANLQGYIQMVPRTTESAYILYQANGDSNCSSYVGRTGGPEQPVYIGAYCSTGNTIHETGHAIGLYHEHTRTDRNTYIQVLTQNVDPAALSNFNIVSSGLNLGAYDYGSIMHYPAFGFSINGQATIVTIPEGIAIGQRSGLSSGDISAVRAMYPLSQPPSATGTVNVNLATSPSGQMLVIDGQNIVTPATLTWVTGSSHTVSAPNATVNGVNYVFAKWSDNGAQTHVVGTSATSLTATYSVRYRLNAWSTSPAQGTISQSPTSADGFYSANSNVVISTSAMSG
ncbi:MAG TPA: M12 family metallopeptidase, partial [Bryobacteraceae bacterium]|nr:M12 family metallopeptidase [Bryobacteraceae bacterium]